MNRTTPTICSLLFLTSAWASPEPISIGDQLFVQAKIIGCDIDARTVEVGKVLESGEAVFFNDISLEVLGKTPEEVAQSLTDSIEEKAGYRPTTIDIVRVAAADDEKSVAMLFEIYNLRRNGCQMRPWRDWQEPSSQDDQWHIAFAHKPMN